VIYKNYQSRELYKDKKLDHCDVRANSHRAKSHPRLAAMWILIALGVLLGGCRLADPEDKGAPDPPATAIQEIEVPENFDFNLRVSRFLCVDLQTPDGAAYPYIKVVVQLPDGQHLATGFTDMDGTVILSFVLPPQVREVVVNAPAIGIIRPQQSLLLNDDLNYLSIR